MILYCCQERRYYINMSKVDYRLYFVEMSKYVKITKFLKDCNIGQSNFSKFLNNDSDLADNFISIEKLELLKDTISKILTNFT